MADRRRPGAREAEPSVPATWLGAPGVWYGMSVVTGREFDLPVRLKDKAVSQGLVHVKGRKVRDPEALEEARTFAERAEEQAETAEALEAAARAAEAARVAQLAADLAAQDAEEAVEDAADEAEAAEDAAEEAERAAKVAERRTRRARRA
jgi:hypothetical protein